MKIKQWICVIAATILTVTSLVGCGTQSGSNTAKTEEKKAESTTESKDDNANVKVGLICSIGGLGDQSVNDQAQAGMDVIKADFGVETKTFEPMEESQVMDMIQKLVDLDYDLIVCNAYSLEDGMRKVAETQPDKNFMILDTIVDMDNVMSFTYATHEGSFMAGVAAALKTKTGVVGYLGGTEVPTIKKFEVGFVEGAKYVNPDIKVISKYIGNGQNVWNDPATAKALTLDMIANGADVCYQVAGGSGLGLIEACVEKDVWAIGVNIDQSHVAPENVLTSMLTRGDVAIQIATKKLLDAEDISGHVVLNCENDGVGLVLNDYFTAEEKTQIEDIKKKIVSGEIVVTDVMAE